MLLPLRRRARQQRHALAPQVGTAHLGEPLAAGGAILLQQRSEVVQVDFWTIDFCRWMH